MGTQPKPEGPTGLSKERVLRTAIELADEGGIGSLSMRNLAQRLGVGVMSLYYYVADKDEILNGIVNKVLDEIDLPRADTDWRTAVRHTAISAHDALRRHPWAAGLMFSAGEGPARLNYTESILRTLRQAFSADLAHRGYHALDSHVVGFTLWAASIPFTREELGDLAASFLADLPTDEYPYLAEHVEQHLTESRDDSERAFEFGLDLILDSLERLREPTGAQGS